MGLSKDLDEGLRVYAASQASLQRSLANKFKALWTTPLVDTEDINPDNSNSNDEDDNDNDDNDDDDDNNDNDINEGVVNDDDSGLED